MTVNRLKLFSLAMLFIALLLTVFARDLYVPFVALLAAMLLRIFAVETEIDEMKATAAKRGGINEEP